MKRKVKGWRGEQAHKIDVTKAYDRIVCGFLRGVAMNMGVDE